MIVELGALNVFSSTLRKLHGKVVYTNSNSTAQPFLGGLSKLMPIKPSAWGQHTGCSLTDRSVTGPPHCGGRSGWVKGFPQCLRAPREQEMQLLISRLRVGLLLTRGAGAFYASSTFPSPYGTELGAKRLWSQSPPVVHMPGCITNVYWALSMY